MGGTALGDHRLSSGDYAIVRRGSPGDENGLPGWPCREWAVYSGGSPRQPRTALSTRVTRSPVGDQTGDEARSRSRPRCSASPGCRRCRPSRSRRCPGATPRPQSAPARRAPSRHALDGDRASSRRASSSESSRPWCSATSRPGHGARRAVRVDGGHLGAAPGRAEFTTSGSRAPGRVGQRQRAPAGCSVVRARNSAAKPVRSATRARSAVGDADVEVEGVRPADLLAQERAEACGRRRGGRPRRSGARRAAPTPRTPCPGSHSGGCSATSRHIRSASKNASVGAGLLQAGRPGLVAEHLPQRGGRDASPASTSRGARRGRAAPRSTSTSAHTAANGLVTE